MTPDLFAFLRRPGLSLAAGLSVAGSILSSPLAAQLPEVATAPSSAIPMDPAIRTGTLPNGLRYYVRRNAWPEERAELRLAVNAGSILEDDDQRGLAHFVEHMAFNGTRHFKKQELVDYIEGLGMRFGAHLNAGTSFDETVYQLQIPTDSAGVLDRALEILEDWAHGVSFDADELEKERGVVVEEWRLGLGAEARMFDRQLPVLLQGSRYAQRLPIGDRATLEKAPREALLRFYRDWYRPDLMAVVAVGDFDPDSVVAMIRTRFGAIPRVATPRPRQVFGAPPHRDALVAIATDKEATSSRVAVYEKSDPTPENTVGDYRRRFMEAIGDGILNLRLFELSRKEDPPFIGAGGGRGSFVRTVEVDALVATVADGGIPRGLEAIMTEAERVKRHGYTEGELDRTRQEYLRSLEMAYNERERTQSAGLADEYVRNFLTGEPLPGIAYEYALARALVPQITLESLNASARLRWNGKNQVIAVNAPAKEGVPVPTMTDLLTVLNRVGASQMVAYEDSVSDADFVPVALAPVRITAEARDTALRTTTWTLANGIRVILKSTDFKNDEVVFTGYSPGGYSLHPVTDYLNAALATTLVGIGGVGTFDAVSLQKRLAGKAVQVGPYIGVTQEGVRGAASPQDLETMFQLIYLYITAPRVDSTAFRAFTSNARAALANRGSDPGAAFDDTLQVTLANHHPFSQPLSSERIADLDLQKALAAYRERFADAGDFTFLIVGRFELDSIRPLVQQYLGNLPATGRKETWKDPGVTGPSGVVKRVVRKGIEPKSQTSLVFSGPFTYGPESREELRWLADLLTMRLRESLREELGGTYGVNVSAVPSRIPKEEYSFAIEFGSAPDRVDQLVTAVWTEIETLQRDGAQEKDLAKLREADARAQEVNRKRNGWWLSQLAHLDQTHEQPAFLQDAARRTARLTPALVRAAARRYLTKTKYVQVTLLPETGATP